MNQNNHQDNESFRDRLDAVCDRFETEWQAGRSPRIENFLQQLPESQRSPAFEELLKVELHCRKNHRDEPRRSDYLERFPEQAEIIRHHLQIQPAAETILQPPAIKIRCPHCHHPIELLDTDSYKDVTCDSCGSSFNLLTDAETASYEQGTGETIGHFQLQAKLGTGAFGTVWKAKDMTLGRLVSKSIEIIVAPNGQTRVETKGFVGSECREASRFLEKALGQQTDELLKPEFHQTTSNEQQIRQNE